MLSSTKHLEYTATLWKSLCLFLYNFFPVDSIDTEVQYTKLSHQRTGDRITRSCMWKNECIQLHTWCAPSFSLPNPSHIFRRIRRDEKKNSFLIFLPLLVSLFRWLLDISMLEIFLIWIVHVFIANMRTVSHFLSPFFFSSFFLIGFFFSIDWHNNSQIDLFIRFNSTAYKGHK